MKNLLPRKTLSLILPAFLAVVFLSLAGNASALTVSPVRIELDVDPGTSIARTIKLTNEQTETKTFYVSFENFTAKGETGKPDFIGGDSDLATWISAPTQVVLKAGEERKVPVTISVPEDADPGGHFAAIFWGTTPPTTAEAGQVAIGGRLGVLILMTVNGDVTEGANLVEFDIDNDQSVLTAIPLTFFYRVQNTGNVRVKPEGDVTVTNMFGGETVVLDANRSAGSALPATTRRFEVIWGEELIEGDELVAEEDGFSLGKFIDDVKYQRENFNFGKYKANLDVVYGSNSTPMNQTISFWIFPWQLLSVVTVSLLVVLFIVVAMFRAYTRMLVKRAIEGNGK